LSSPAITDRVKLPTPFGPEDPGEQPGRPIKVYRNIFGISTRKVYPHCTLLHSSVRSYHTFSPLSHHHVTRRFVFCGTILSFPEECPPVRWCDALRCPDFPLQVILQR